VVRTAAGEDWEKRKSNRSSERSDPQGEQQAGARKTTRAGRGAARSERKLREWLKRKCGQSYPGGLFRSGPPGSGKDREMFDSAGAPHFCRTLRWNGVEREFGPTRASYRFG